MGMLPYLLVVVHQSTSRCRRRRPVPPWGLVWTISTHLARVPCWNKRVGTGASSADVGTSVSPDYRTLYRYPEPRPNPVTTLLKISFPFPVIRLPLSAGPASRFTHYARIVSSSVHGALRFVMMLNFRRP